MSQQKKTVVIGDGWASLGALYFISSQDESICWVTGVGTRRVSPLSTLASGPGVEVWKKIAKNFDPESFSEEGTFVREYRNKGWKNLEELSEEIFWKADQKIFGKGQVRLGSPLSELEESLRSYLDSAALRAKIEKKPNIPVKGFRGILKEDRKPAESNSYQVILGSGEVIECSRIIYADRWLELPQMDGLPKPLSFLRNREPLGALQARFGHNSSISIPTTDNFLSVLSRETDREPERQFFGYFSENGEKSTWTLCLTSAEAEDNHQIGKRFRKLKTILEKMFPGFAASMTDEQVKFHEEFIFSQGESIEEPIQLPKVPEVFFLSDSCGPAAALSQVSYFQEPVETPLLNPERVVVEETRGIDH